MAGLEDSKSKIHRLLRENYVSQTELYNEIERDINSRKTLDSKISMPNLSNIVTGKKSNLWINTYLKILKALNKLTGKDYTLDDIVDPDMVSKEIDKELNSRTDG